jgi:hypothetical protein
MKFLRTAKEFGYPQRVSIPRNSFHDGSYTASYIIYEFPKQLYKYTILFLEIIDLSEFTIYPLFHPEVIF